MCEVAPCYSLINSLLQGYFGCSWNHGIPLRPLRPMYYPQAYDHPELAR